METPGNWQSVLAKIVKDSFPKKYLDEFETCQSEAEKIAFINGFDFIRKVGWVSAFFNSNNSQTLKNLATGLRLKEEGTELFRRKQYKEAVRKYSEAIVKIPQESDELGIMYGNRSASLFYLRHYQECLEDIETAKNSNFPTEKLHKLLVREINCQIELGHLEQAEQGLTQLNGYIESDRVDSKLREQLKQEVVKLGKKLDRWNREQTHEKSLSLPNVSYGHNKLLVQASSAVDIQYTVEQGRFLTANQDIRRGDTVIVERPYAAVLLPKNMDTHCYNCYVKLNLNFYPCRRCTSVKYCSMRCESDSWENFHRTECPYLPLLHSVGIAHLSFKVVLTARLRYLREFMKRQSAVESSQKYKGFDETGTYSRSYQSVYDLMTHSEDMETEDLLQYTLTALLLLEILRHSGWFGSGGNADYEMKDLADLKDERMTHDERLIGSLLLRHILQLVCNAHAITELQCSQTTNSVVEEQNQVRIATAIYPTASLMNHSCDPSIIASFNKDTLVVRAVKDITKREEVFNCYGPHHKRMSLDERQQSLQQQYFFTCQCKPCTAGERTSQFLYSYRCKQCEGPSVTNTSNTICCQTCGFIDSQDLVSVKKADSLFQDGVKLLQENRNSDALDVLLECCKLRQECFYKHNKILSETQDCIARCYASLGNFEDSAKFLRQSIEAVKVIYGPESIETGNELQKLTEILISAHRWQEALDCVHDAIKIFTEHYSESHETVRELFDMKEQLVQVLEFSR